MINNRACPVKHRTCEKPEPAALRHLPAATSPSLTGAKVILLGSDSLGYQCSSNDQLEPLTDPEDPSSALPPTDPMCFCQCTCEVIEEADSLYESMTTVASSASVVPSSTSAFHRFFSKQRLCGTVETIHADGNKQLATSATAAATTTIYALVKQLGPRAGFERRISAH